MPSAKPLTKEMILDAMDKTKSNRAACRYLGVSYPHYKQWAKQYKATKKGYPNLFEQHKNPSGKGIPKFLSDKQNDFSLLDLIEGRLDASSFNPDKIKYRLFQEGYLKEKCTRCGFEERRVLDYKMPLLLNFRDGNKHYYHLDNLEVLCYNCYFLTIGSLFNNNEIDRIESHKSIDITQTAWELDDYHYERLKELGLGDKEKNTPENIDLDDIIDYI
jgi:hypothetical protein